jgi:CRISPR system Cascade subunit CasE
MGVAELDALRAPASTGPIHWTRFRAAAMPDNWGDHRAAHRAVMRLFPADLGADEARSRHGILFRADLVDGERVILVQSLTAPMLVPPSARTLLLTGRTWQVEPGTPVRFRVAVNPIRRHERAERVVPVGDAGGWLGERLAGALDSIEIVNHARTEYRQHRGRDRLTLDTFDAFATVSDTATLDALRGNGVGRRKAYGAGLLTVQPIG